MSPKQLKVILLSVLALLLVACGVYPIYNVDNAPATISSPSYDLTDVTKAIQRAGTELGWRMVEQTPGHIVGTLFLRSHVAIVDITYTLDEYSIQYRNSANLNYNAANNTIHNNYNGWIKNLNNAIIVRLATI